MGPVAAAARPSWLMKLAGTGASRADSEERAHRVWVVNAVCLVVSLVGLGNVALTYWLTGHTLPWLLGGAFITLLLAPLALNMRGHFDAATWMLVLTANVGQLLFARMFGNASGVFLGGILWSVVSGLFFDPAQRVSLTTARTLPLMGLVGAYAYGLQHAPWLEASEAELQNLFAATLASVCGLLWLTSAANDARTRRRATQLEATHERAQQHFDRALRESEGRFGLLLQQAGDALLVVDDTGTIVDANAQANADLGVDPTGRPIWEVDTTLSRAVLRPLTQELLAGTRYRAEHTYRRANGGTFVADVRASAIETASGRQLLVSARDTTEQRELQTQLMLAERLASVGTLAAGVAHEVNNPLSFIHMHVEMLRRRLAPHLPSLPPEDTAALEQSLSRAQEGTERVGRIVGDLMTFARGQDADVGTADVAEVLRSTLNLADAELRNRVRVVKHVEAVPPARASASRLGQVFLNLVLNARHELSDSGVADPTLTVRVRYLRRHTIEVRIEDNGLGMAPSVAQRVFEPFYTTKQAGKGTGLGLFVCRNLITELGGSIELDTAPGQGARFTVLLPAASENDLWSDEGDASRSGIRGRERFGAPHADRRPKASGDGSA